MLQDAATALYRYCVDTKHWLSGRCQHCGARKVRFADCLLCGFRRLDVSGKEVF